MKDAVLEADDVTYAYGRKSSQVLDGLSIKISPNKKTGLLGQNGAGKSTLFNVLNALYKPASGTVLYNGQPVSYRHKSIIRMRSEVSILFQNPNDMIFKPYVGQDVAYGPENLKLPKEEVDARVDEALFAVGMESFRESPIMKLSYGQRKRVSLAGVLAMRPKVLILDEPTAGLDPQMASEVMEITEQLHSSGVTVVMSSHDSDLIYSWADEIHVLSSSKCVYSGDPVSFYSDYGAVQDAGLLLPTVFKIDKTLSGPGSISEKPCPRTRAQLTATLVGGPDREFGTLHVICVNRDDSPADLLERASVAGVKTGIYGMSARMACNRTGFHASFTYDAPDNCLANCLEGNDSVILCDPLIADKAASMAEFVKNNGLGKLDVQVHNR
ncbi:MAG: ABC transporter ATP-binding protein [Candidatus Methanomethylophilaceae archaeon]|nr:ABC transporter ATP-binding protein [Candidatus Methanomethylophilaceae archaeon]